MANTGTIDQLNFEVIIDDSSFNTTIKALNQAAQELNVSLSSILGQLGKGGVKSFEKLSATVQGTNTQLARSRDLMRDLTQLAGITFGIAGIRQFISGLTRITGEFEVQKAALTSMLQDADKADAIFKELRTQALQSPYTFQDLSKYAKQLTAFNIDSEQLVETEKRLADVAAGLGVDMGRIILAYGQVKAAGVLKGTELRQFTEAGVPLLQQLADQIKRTEGNAISLSEVFQRISKKEIPFEMVEQAFRDMTNAGGQFYNMQEVLVGTLQGKIGKLRDVWQQLLYDVGSSSDILKSGVDALTAVVSNLNKFGGIIKSLVVGVGAYGAMLAVAATAQKLVFGAEALANLGKYIKQIRAATTAMEAFSMASHMASTVAVVLGALVAVGFGLYKSFEKANEGQRRLNKTMAAFDGQADKEIEKLDELKAKFESAAKGTKEYDDAREEIIKNYGKYYDGLDTEIDKVGSLETAYDKLTTAVRESLRERQYQEFEKEERRIMDEAIGTALEDLTEKAYKKLGRASGYSLMNSLRDAIKNSTSRQDFYSQFDIVFMRGLGPGLMNKIDKVFALAEKKRADYLKNTRALINEYGLNNSNLDPDFIGPILPAAGKTDNTKPEQQTWSGNRKNQAEEEEKLLKARISGLQKLKKAYDDLASNPLIGDDNAKSLMERFYGVTNMDFEGQIRELADQLIRLNPELTEYVEGINEAFGKDAVSEYVKSLSALDSVGEKITEYLSKDFSVDGEKVGYKISKAFTDLFNKNVKIDLNVDKIVKDLEEAGGAIRTNYLIENADKFKEAGISEEEQERLADAYWDEYKKRRVTELRDQAEQEKAYNKKATEEQVKGFASEIYGELTRGLDLSDWAHKSLGEINDIIQKLGEVDLPGEIKEKLKDYPELLKALSEALGELADADVDKANQKKWEKVAKGLQKAAKALSPAIAAMRGLGEAMGDEWLSDMADHLDNLVSTTSSFIDSMAKGEPFSAYTAAISYAVNEVMGLISANIELKRSIRETAEESRRQAFSNSLSQGVDSIFGSNELKKVNNAITSIEKLRKLTAADRGDNRDMNTSKQAKWWEFFLAPTASSAWAKLFTSKTDTLSGMASKLGMSLYDEYGNLSADTLSAILNTYKDLKQADKEWIQSAINNSEAYAEAMEQLDGVMESLFGDIATSATDAIVNGWLEAQSAALNYADILDDVAQSYAKMLIKSMILDEVLNEDAVKAVKEAFVRGDSVKAMALVEENLQKIADMEPVFQQVMEGFEPYFNREGSGTSGSTSSGIKSITEDTANLLASYINAMRADLSVVRAMQTVGWQDVKAIREAVQGQYTPNYNEYMAQIAANTYDMAQSNMEILSRIKSVITPSPSGGSAVRTSR